MAYAIINLIGQRYDRLLVTEFIDVQGHGARWKCRCDCGKLTIVAAGNLKSKQTRSCGCIRQKHGMKGTKIYRIWSAMIERCYRRNNMAYQQYGGRGIYVCRHWRMSFLNFYRDMGLPPVGKTLDRVDNDGPYSPENCRWATRIEQANNTQVNHRIFYNGKHQTIAEWTRELNVPYWTIKNRLRWHWPIDKILTTPVRSCKRR